MGDHRASIKIEFTAAGKTYNADMYINYCPDDGCGVDWRVLEFLRDSWMDAYARYEIERHEGERASREQEAQKRELAELKRLTEKYASGSQSVGL